MSFREKSAWISLFCLLIFTALWLTHALRIEFFGAENDNPMLWFFGTLAALIALEIGLHVAIAIQSPREAKTPKDERERLIDMKASRVAFYVLMIGAFVSIGTLHVPSANRYTMAQCLMGSILFALLIRFATQIALHRRDA
jgi:uncharacterized membrane protein